MKLNDKFEVFHRSNPLIYKAFKEICLSKIAAGHERIGSKYVIETIRYTLRVKVSNNFTPYYSRRFVREFPQFTELFIFKKIK